MGIPWRSAESMHWQLGEQEMSARANAPVFQLHPSATSLSSPPTSLVVPAPAPGPIIPAPHGFTPTNAPPPPQLVSHQALPPHPQQHHQPPAPPPPPPPSGPIQHQTFHQRTESGPGHRRRNSSFSRRRADARSRASVPPQLGPTLPQINPRSEADLISGARTAPAPSSYLPLKRDEENEQLGELSGKRKREEEGGLRADAETRSLGGRSPDRSSQRSATGSIKSLKRGEPEES